MTFESPKAYLRALEGDPSLAIMSVQMVADFRGVTRAAIDRLLRLGRLDEIRIDKTRYVRAASVVALQKAEDDRVVMVRRFLEDCARKGVRRVFYDPVMTSVGLSWQVPNDRGIIGGILGDVSRQTWKEHRILLSVLVHNKKAGITKPGQGFFDLVTDMDDVEDWDDEDSFVARETERVLRFYRDR